MTLTLYKLMKTKSRDYRSLQKGSASKLSISDIDAGGHLKIDTVPNCKGVYQQGIHKK